MSDIPVHILIKSARAWRPEPGDILRGHVITVQARTSEYGTYPVVYLQEDDEAGNDKLWAIHAFHTVLKAEYMRVKPGPGNYLETAYLGKHPSAKRKDSKGEPVLTHLYSASDGTETEVASWDQAWATGDEPGF